MESLVNYSLITNEVSIVNHKLSNGNFTAAPKIRQSINKIDDNRTAVTYELKISNTKKNPFPIDLKVSMTGVFDVSKLEPDKVDDFIKVQTCQIVFPQIRAIVASLTASALMPPLLIPIIDARKVFGNTKTQDDSK